MSFFFVHPFLPYVFECIEWNPQDDYPHSLRAVPLHGRKFFRVFCDNQQLRIDDLPPYEALHRSRILATDLRIFPFVHDLSHPTTGPTY